MWLDTKPVLYADESLSTKDVISEPFKAITIFIPSNSSLVITNTNMSIIPTKDSDSIPDKKSFVYPLLWSCLAITLLLVSIVVISSLEDIAEIETPLTYDDIDSSIRKGGIPPNVNNNKTTDNTDSNSSISWQIASIGNELRNAYKLFKNEEYTKAKTIHLDEFSILETKENDTDKTKLEAKSKY